VFIKEENRHKTNEVVIARPDVSSVVLYKRSETNNFEDTQVVLVKEFRSPVANDSGYVWEIPGGSSWENSANTEQVAIDEVHEEVGLSLKNDRLRSHPSRQVASTMSTHKGHLFSAELTTEELNSLIQKQSQGQVHGVAEVSERTYVQVQTISEIMKRNLVDWSCLGMILYVLHST
jgi:8-oxo-dGTP pyrophosphatase MutT (NUDIX family)